MSKDALNRRLRSAPSAPYPKRLALTDTDLLLFEAIDRHGPLPSNYLYEYTRGARRDRSHLQNRLTEFYNGDTGGAYLVRPPQQFASYRARYQHLVYDLAPRAKVALAERGLQGRGGDGRGEPFVHRLMGSCVAASFELLAPAHGIRYISLSEILARPTCGGARDAANPLAIPRASGAPTIIVPDRLFGLHYPSAGYRFFAVECDRSTESIERRNLSQTSLARKFAGYAALLRSHAYRTWWGIPNLHVLVVTTGNIRSQNILAHLKREMAAPYQDRFAVAVEHSFGADWHVPPGLLTHLLDCPWRTPIGAKDLGHA